MESYNSTDDHSVTDFHSVSKAIVQCPVINTMQRACCGKNYFEGRKDCQTITFCTLLGVEGVRIESSH